MHLGTWEQTWKEMPRLPSPKAALTELSLIPSSQSAYLLAGIVRGTGGGVAKDIAAGEAALIPSSLDLGAAVIGSLGLSQGTDGVAGGERSLPFTPYFPLEDKRDGFSKDVTDRLSKYAGEFVRWALSALVKQPSSPEVASQHRPTVGRHRKAPELGAVPQSIGAEDTSTGQKSIFA